MTPRSRPSRVGALWHRARVVAARDATAVLTTGSAVVLAPHPDDEVIACGLLMAAKLADRQRVVVVLGTDGRKGWFADGPEPGPDAIAAVRRSEWHRALDAVGVAGGDRHELGYPDGGLSDHEDAAAGAIAGLLAGCRPSQVFVSAPDDLHADHRALARATCRAVVAACGSGPAPALLAYRVYPEAGLWPADRPHGGSPFRDAARLLRSLPRLTRDRELLLMAPDRTAAKARAVAAYVSQERLLTGELRGAWAGGVELFHPLDPSGC